MSETIAQILQSINSSELRISIEKLIERYTQDIVATVLQHDDSPIVGTADDGVSYMDFNITPDEIDSSPGRVHWNANDQTLDVDMLGGVVLQVGQEQFVYATNNSGADISNGQAVFIAGADVDDHVEIALAQADAYPDTFSIGVTTQDIDDADNGYVTTMGLVRGVDTSSLVAGAAVFLSDTPGELVASLPETPSFFVIMGVCVKSDATDGIMFVNVQIMPRVQDLSDVYGTPSNGDTIRWNATNSRFEFGV